MRIPESLHSKDCILCRNPEAMQSVMCKYQETKAKVQEIWNSMIPTWCAENGIPNTHALVVETDYRIHQQREADMINAEKLRLNLYRNELGSLRHQYRTHQLTREQYIIQKRSLESRYVTSVSAVSPTQSQRNRTSIDTHNNHHNNHHNNNNNNNNTTHAVTTSVSSGVTSHRHEPTSAAANPFVNHSNTILVVGSVVPVVPAAVVPAAPTEPGSGVGAGVTQQIDQSSVDIEMTDPALLHTS